MICIFSHSSCTNLNYLFFLFLLHAAFKVATNRSAILSKSASCSLFSSSMRTRGAGVGCALTFASEAKFEIEAKISLRLEAKKTPYVT
jgi:hypothetical protein